jgi:hypothetical protein
MENSISAATNPALANKLAQEAMNAASREVPALVELSTIVAPPVGAVTLIAGYYNSFEGDLITSAEVRELTGADEEAIAKAPDIGRGLMMILQRATVSIGDQKATVEVLDQLLSGDRELLLLEIRKATFGDEVDIYGPCPNCGELDQKFLINLSRDVTVKHLEDPVGDRQFEVSCKVGTVVATLPTGKVQKKLVQSTDKTSAELDTILLKDCIASINGLPVYDTKQILNLGMVDRRKLLTEIAERNPGPELSEVKNTCPSCSQEVTIPLSLADLFRW